MYRCMCYAGGVQGGYAWGVQVCIGMHWWYRYVSICVVHTMHMVCTSVYEYAWYVQVHKCRHGTYRYVYVSTCASKRVRVLQEM